MQDELRKNITSGNQSRTKKNSKKGLNKHKNVERLKNAYYGKEAHGLTMNTHNATCVDPNKKINGLGMNINNITTCCNTSSSLFQPLVIFHIHSKIGLHNPLH
jgi:hypothetical protein